MLPFMGAMGIFAFLYTYAALFTRLEKTRALNEQTHFLTT